MTYFELIISPFLFIIKKLFLFGYSITENYGLSIVFLSFSISLLLLPIFILIEKAKKRDDALKRKMKPALDEIKRCYKGQERYYYIRTLNKQHNYSPIRSLIPILSLLLQIPFFIAAYQFLENFQPLAGISFLFINDLSTPDAFFGVVNILPIAMTVVNLLTAYFYTRNGDTSERKQMLGVATIFLVLLFNLPSGLVLYWTMNNVFSFFRLFITNPEVFKKQKNNSITLKNTLIILKTRFVSIFPKLQITFFALSIILVLFQFNSAFNNNFDGIFLKISKAMGISVGITLIIALFTITHNIKQLKAPIRIKEFVLTLWPIFKPLLFILLILTIGSQINWAFTYNFNDILQRLVISVIGSILITTIIALICFIYQGQIDFLTTRFRFNIALLERNYKITFGLLLAFTLSAICLFAYFNHFNNILLKIVSAFAISWLFILAVANIPRTIKRNPMIVLKKAKNDQTIKPWIFFSISFLSLYFYLAGKYYFEEINATLNLISILFTVGSQVIGWLYFKGIRERIPKIIFYFSALLFSLIFLLQIFYLSLFLIGNEVVFNPFESLQTNNDFTLSNIILPGIVFIVFTLFYFIKYQTFKLNIPNKGLLTVFILSLFYTLSLVFFWSPLIVFSSFPEAFSFPAVEIFVKNFSLFALIYAIGIFIYLIIPKTLKFILTILSVLLALIYFLNSFIIPVNVGTLQLGKYINASNLAMQPIIYLFEGLFLIVAYFLIKKLLGGKYIKHIKLALIGATLILISQSLIASINEGNFFSKSDRYINLPSSMSFSKDKENIVFFIADMFMGMHMKYILEESPELKTTFEGFVWYPNTLSVSTNTCPAISSLQAGFNFNIDNLNKDKSRTMAEKVTEASVLFSDKIKSKGYQLTSTRMVYSAIDKNTYDAYLPNWHSDWNKWNKELKIGGTKELDFTILWKNAIFYGLPLSLKPIIYNNGKWITVEDETNKNTSLSQPCNFVRLMPYISDTLNAKGNFIYIHSEATHHPWNIVNDDGMLFRDVSSYENQKWFIQSFAKWINWMKENGVYDNTKIIILSDHSHYLPDNELNDFGGIYKWDKNGQEKISVKEFWRVNALLLVKDINAKGSLIEDWRFLSNADAPAIAFNENDPTKNKPPVSRSLPVFFVDYGPKIASKKYLEIQNQFQVKDYVFNSNNWHLIK